MTYLTVWEQTKPGVQEVIILTPTTSSYVTMVTVVKETVTHIWPIFTVIVTMDTRQATHDTTDTHHVTVKWIPWYDVIYWSPVRVRVSRNHGNSSHICKIVKKRLYRLKANYLVNPIIQYWRCLFVLKYKWNIWRKIFKILIIIKIYFRCII